MNFKLFVQDVEELQSFYSYEWKRVLNGKSDPMRMFSRRMKKAIKRRNFTAFMYHAVYEQYRTDIKVAGESN